MFLINHPILYTITLLTVCLTIVIVTIIIKGGPDDKK